MAHTIQRSPRGADAQVGFAVETTYGTQVTPATVFLATTSGGIGLKPRSDNRIPSAARIPGRISRANGFDVTYNAGGEGSLAFELQRKNMLKLWRWATGHNATPVAQGGTAAYLTTFNKDATAARMNATGTALSIQTGVPMRDGSVEPFDFVGCKCSGWEMSCDAGQFATVAFNVDARSAIHTSDLAAPSYPAEYVPLGWQSAAVVKRAGTALAGVRSVKFTAENGLTGPDRKLLDATGLYAEPILTDDATGTLEITLEPTSLTPYDDWSAHTPRAYVVEFVGAVIASTYCYTWRLTIPEGYVQGDPPEQGGDEITTHTITIDASDNGTDPLYKLEVIETATTI